MNPADYDITVYSGDSFSQPFQFLQSDGVTPVDLTGGAILAQIRDEYDVLITTFSVAQTLNQGRVTISLNATQSQLFAGLSFLRYDVQWTSTGGATVVTYVRGKVRVLRDVSHA